jgi:hypothetical protein
MAPIVSPKQREFVNPGGHESPSDASGAPRFHQSVTGMSLQFAPWGLNPDL